MPATDVLIAGAGPTGLALAAQLIAFGATVRIVDRRPSPARASRALIVQPRTLEALRPLGITAALVARGDAAATARLHLRGREVTVDLHDPCLDDTPYPFLLAVRQAETERVLREHLRERGLSVEWATEYVSCRQDRSGVTAVLRRADGGDERLRAAYLVGCDGAASTVRRSARIGFAGAPYRQSVLLADVALDTTLPAEPLHAFVGGSGAVVLFAGGERAPWRLIVIREGRSRTAGPVDAGGLRALVEHVTGARVRIAHVAWQEDIPQQRRLADAFTSGRVVLAGDAAHVHTPAGARGMNTGIQDACNLGWKLALVVRGVAAGPLLDTYEAERRRAARASLLLTHLIFFGEAADHPVLRWARGLAAPFVVPPLIRPQWARRLALRTIGQLGGAYRASAIAVEGRPRLRRGPRPGARMPDAPLSRDGAPYRLHDALAVPGFHLLLCGDPRAWRGSPPARGHRGLVHVHRISTDPLTGGLHDPGGMLLRRLGARRAAQYLIRPDGHVGYRCAGTDLGGVTRTLAAWLPGTDAEGAAQRGVARGLRGANRST